MTWVRRESEAEQRLLDVLKVAAVEKGGKCWLRRSGGFCADFKQKSQEIIAAMEKRRFDRVSLGAFGRKLRFRGRC